MVIDTLRKSISYGLLLISIVIYSAGNRTAGDYVFKGAVAALCISVIIALVSKTYKKKTIKETWQLTIVYIYGISFYIFALISDVTNKERYKLIVIEAFLLILQGCWIGLSIWTNGKIKKKIRWSRGKIYLPLVVIACVFAGMIYIQSKEMYRWDSLDYAQQVLAMAQQFDFTLSSLQVINYGHISMGFAAVYEYGYFIFRGNVNCLIWINLILGMLTGISVYVILRETYPRRKSYYLVLATCMVVVMPLYYGVNGAISTDYIMTNFFIYFLLAHKKNYKFMQFVTAFIMVMTKETAVVLLGVFSFCYLFLEMTEQRTEPKYKIILEKGISFLPVILWGVILFTKQNSMWLDRKRILDVKVLGTGIVFFIFGLLMLFLVYRKWNENTAKLLQYTILGIIIAGMIFSILYPKVEATYGPMEKLNSIGFLGIGYIALRLKNLFLLNFQWVYWCIIAAFLWIDIKRAGRIWNNKYVISLSMAVLMFVIVHCIYLTYTHPRYYQPIVLLIGMYAAVLLLAYRKTVARNAMIITAMLSFCQNFAGFDLVSKYAYATVDTGNGTLLTTSYCKKELPYSDACVYNFQYTYLNQLLLQFVQDVRPGEKTLFIMEDVTYPYSNGKRAKYAVWGFLWYSEYAGKIYFDGANLNNFKQDGDVKVRVKTFNSENTIDLSRYNRVYYIKIPEKTDEEKTTQWFLENYKIEKYRTYKIMNWEMDTYAVYGTK